MKLYSKSLHSLEELKREKHVLRYAAKHSDDLLSFGETGSKHKSTDEAASAGIVGTMISALGSKSMFNSLLAIAPPVISLISKRTGSRKNPLESLFKEIISGYIKWKLVQMAYRSVTKMVRSKDKDRHESIHA